MMKTLTRFDCPLCERVCKTQNHLRCHLEEHHRKSQIIDAYLDEVGE